MKNAFNLLVFLFVANVLLAQNPKSSNTYGLQLGISDALQIDELMERIDGFNSNSRAMLVEQSVKAYMMPPRKVEDPTLASVYMVCSALEYYLNVDKNLKENLSPEYIYLSLTNTVKSPKLKDIFDFLATNGTISATIMPYGSRNYVSGVNATQRYKIANYLQIFREQTKPRQKIFEIRKALMRGNPCIVEIEVVPSFDETEGKVFFDAKSSKKNMVKRTVIVVAFDEEKEGVELLNCQGRKWGIDGHIWMAYEDFGNAVLEGYVLLPE